MSFQRTAYATSRRRKALPEKYFQSYESYQQVGCGLVRRLLDVVAIKLRISKWRVIIWLKIDKQNMYIILTNPISDGILPPILLPKTSTDFKLNRRPISDDSVPVILF